LKIDVYKKGRRSPFPGLLSRQEQRKTEIFVSQVISGEMPKRIGLFHHHWRYEVSHPRTRRKKKSHNWLKCEGTEKSEERSAAWYKNCF
jgi:hypothetical protein